MPRAAGGRLNAIRAGLGGIGNRVAVLLLAACLPEDEGIRGDFPTNSATPAISPNIPPPPDSLDAASIPSSGTAGSATPPEQARSDASQLPPLELVGQYGCESCQGPDLFGRIVAVAAGPGNSFAVATAEEPFVRIWNRDTGVVTQFGRAGDGPGDMRRPVGLVLRSDSVVVLEEVITYWHIGGSLLVAAGFDDQIVPIVKVWAVR